METLPHVSPAKPDAKPMKPWNQRLWDIITSFRLAVWILGISTLLVFLGTMAQVSQGLYDAQTRWFQSWWFVKRPTDPAWMWAVPIFPGGYTMGVLFLVNMLSAHFRRFQKPPGGPLKMLGHYSIVYLGLLLLTVFLLWSPWWFFTACSALMVLDMVLSRSGTSLAGSGRKLGVDMVHIGLAVLMLGQVLTDQFSEESHLSFFNEGEQKGYTEKHREVELAFTVDVPEATGLPRQRLISVPQPLLDKKASEWQSHADLPFQFRVKQWWPNSDLVDGEEAIQQEATIRQAMARLEAEYSSADNLPAAAEKGMQNPGRLPVWQAALQEVNLPSEDVLAAAKQAAQNPEIAGKLLDSLKTRFRKEMLDRFTSQGGAMRFAALTVLDGKSVADVKPPAQADSPVATRYFTLPMPEAKDMESRNLPSAVVELQQPDGKQIGSWLVTPMLKEQTLTTPDGKTWQISLRSQRIYLPYNLKLLETTHDVYQGTNTPKDYRSKVLIDNPANKGELREVEISMNNPLRYEGLTFYQHQMSSREQMAAGRKTSTLQVMKNPSWFSPYYGCALVGYGLARHFILHLLAFLARRKKSGERSKAPENTATGELSTPATGSGALAKWLPAIVTLIMLAWPLSHYFRGSSITDKSMKAPLTDFSRLPVVTKGRVQPLDSLARSSLMLIRGKQVLNCEPWVGEFGGPKMISAMEWLMEVAFEPAIAAERPVFRVDNDGVKQLLALPMAPDKNAKQDGKHYTWALISQKLPDLKRELQRAGNIKSDLRNAYERSLMKLGESVAIYQQLSALFGPAASGDLAKSLTEFRGKIMESRTALELFQSGEPHDESKLEWLQIALNTPLIVPPHQPELGKENNWVNAITGLAKKADTAEPHPIYAAYSEVASSYLKRDATAMSAAVAKARSIIEKDAGPKPIAKGKAEQTFKHIETFYKASVLCVLGAVLGLLSWLFSPSKAEILRRCGFWLVFLAMILLALGLVYRMTLEGRPPVTNLYSSAVFIGWAATLFGLLLE